MAICKIAAEWLKRFNSTFLAVRGTDRTRRWPRWFWAKLNQVQWYGGRSIADSNRRRRMIFGIL